MAFRQHTAPIRPTPANERYPIGVKSKLLVSAQRIPSLDGLRAISITLVVLSHLVKWKHVSLGPVQTYGDLGVHIFFVLSGYLITNLLLREHERSFTISLRDFYIRRAFRIFPAALVFLVVVTALYWHEIRWYHTLAALLYVANMDISRHGSSVIYGPSVSKNSFICFGHLP
jgi:peptidoglycan/LPS O-acetylase OafA/YrhL